MRLYHHAWELLERLEPRSQPCPGRPAVELFSQPLCPGGSAGGGYHHVIELPDDDPDLIADDWGNALDEEAEILAGRAPGPRRYWLLRAVEVLEVRRWEAASGEYRVLRPPR